MSVAALSSSQAPVIVPRTSAEEANESSAERAREANQASQQVKAAPAQGTGTVVDVTA